MSEKSSYDLTLEQTILMMLVSFSPPEVQRAIQVICTKENLSSDFAQIMLETLGKPADSEGVAPIISRPDE